ncbi:MAG: hypothetical protein JWL84_3430 [Rhodospirillales bacterium]|jgi:hypothetical protein|nr:hypothetical protein [Rhodospirillales bacterium]
MTVKAAFLIMVSLSLPALGAGPARAADEDTRPLSPAQIALFESDHLRDIHQAAQLEYRFHHQTQGGKDDGDFDDRIALDLHPREDGGKDVWVDFLSGPHHVAYPPLMDFHGNPILMFFLEHDVDEMRRATGAAATFFRNTIRRAFVDQAAVKTIEVERDGKSLSATEITLAPFAGDSQVATAFPALKDKQYRFVLSKAVPGQIYEITAQLPGTAGGAPLARDSMVFAGELPCTTTEGPCTGPATP